MKSRMHCYRVTVSWTSTPGRTTTTRSSYSRDTELSAGAKPPIAGSSDPAFLGDSARWNPEELLVASLSQCHLLWYLDFAARAGVEVTDYVDEPIGLMAEQLSGAGQFSEVTLRPTVTITPDADPATALRLHSDAHAHCFIARSMNFPVRHEPTVHVVKSRPAQPDPGGIRHDIESSTSSR